MPAFQFMDAASGELREMKTIGVVLPEFCLVRLISKFGIICGVP